MPASARAVVVSPSVVADRYVQLTPAYTGGPQIADGATIPISRTAVPVEVDQIYASLSKLSAALGPNGVNKHGALSDLIRSGAANLAGNGGYLHNMITQFSGLSKTLGGSAGNLYATIAYLEQFTAMLKANNGQVQLAEQQLASVFGFLATDRQDLGAALNELATALGQVQTFVGGQPGPDQVQRDQAGVDHRTSWSASGPRWPRRSTSPRSRWTTWSTPTTPPPAPWTAAVT